jgi:hypothetical protein
MMTDDEWADYGLSVEVVSERFYHDRKVAGRGKHYESDAMVERAIGGPSLLFSSEADGRSMLGAIDTTSDWNADTKGGSKHESIYASDGLKLLNDWMKSC